MSAGNQAPKAKRGRPAKPPDLAKQRDELVALLPDAILAIANCIRRPGRNSQTQLAAAKTVLDRAGLPAIASTTISAPDGGPVRHSGKFVIELVEAPKAKT
jgi:hypothetical protein